AFAAAAASHIPIVVGAADYSADQIPTSSEDERKAKVRTLELLHAVRWNDRLDKNLNIPVDIRQGLVVIPEDERRIGWSWPAIKLSDYQNNPAANLENYLKPQNTLAAEASLLYFARVGPNPEGAARVKMLIDNSSYPFSSFLPAHSG